VYKIEAVLFEGPQHLYIINLKFAIGWQPRDVSELDPVILLCDAGAGPTIAAELGRYRFPRPVMIKVRINEYKIEIDKNYLR
jgi:hypothetical protein